MSLATKSEPMQLEGDLERIFLIWNIANWIVFFMNLMQKECFFYSILNEKGGVSDAQKYS